MSDPPSKLLASLTVTGQPASVAQLRTAVEAAAIEVGASASTIADARLATSEAATNAVRHAYDDGNIVGEIRLSTAVERNHPDNLVVSVSDDGPGVRPRPDSPGLGLGLPLIHAVAGTVEIVDRTPGATIRMRFPLP